MKHISVSALKETLEAERSNPTVAFINVCTPEEYREKHIEGVESFPLDRLAKDAERLRDKKTIYVHCRSGKRSQRAIEELTHLGIQAELVNVEGGLMAWEGAGHKTRSLSSSSSSFPITQQVFIAAGSLILTGLLLAYVIHPLFLLLPTLVGGGLLFAGLTGWCGMALLLMRMPWNKS